MRSFLLGQLALPLSVAGAIVAAGLLVKGHDTPGGGFVAGLSGAFIVVLLIAGRGTRWFRDRVRVAPESMLLVGVGLLFAAAFGPTLLGLPALTQDTARVVLPDGRVWKIPSSLLFDLGVALSVGSGLASAVLVLWERLALEEKVEP